MEVKNLKVYQPQEIRIETADETVVIKRVPAIATLTLNRANSLVSELLQIKLPSKDEPDNAEKLKTEGDRIAKVLLDNYDTVIQVLMYALSKDKAWIETNLGHIAMIQIIMAILVSNMEESLDAVKKNNLMS